MPRKLTEEEIEIQRKKMYEQGVRLIREKGLTNLILEDITNATQMAKGTFYNYFPSKEDFLYQTILKNGQYYFQMMIEEGKKRIKTKEEILFVLEKTFLCEDCLFGYISAEDYQYLMRHLSDKINEMDQDKSQMNYKAISELMGMKETEENFATLSYLMDALQSVIRSTSNYGEQGRKRATRIIASALVDFFLTEGGEK